MLGLPPALCSMKMGITKGFYPFGGGFGGVPHSHHNPPKSGGRGVERTIFRRITLCPSGRDL